jgi:superfamily II DNA or RNA helicase
MSLPISLTYDRGTLLLGDLPKDFDTAALPGVLFDPRTSQYRAKGIDYRGIVEHLRKQQIPYTDSARGWENKSLGWKMTTDREPYPHQKEAIDTWWRSGARGVVVLPTGTGKSFVASLAIEKTNRPTLIVVPTIDLMNQWFANLTELFGVPVGLVGGGYYEFKDLAVTTYDSSYIHLERWGNKYGLLVFDEAHHLPGATYQEAALGALAPFRLGLTATPERADGGEQVMQSLIGPIIYRREIQELSGDYLAEYRTQRVYVDLTPDEQARYTACREEYRKFVFDNNIQLGGMNGWQNFIFQASRSPQGQSALRAFYEQKRIERQASGKFNELERLLSVHNGERTIIFTADNATVYDIARRYLVPAITHQTKIKERKAMLERFHSGEYTVLVTSQVLNEGVDVPAAGVGVVLSGSGTVRENVQRLGRILRKYKEKQAVLYEIIARGTAEEFSSERRRQHGAFQ